MPVILMKQLLEAGVHFGHQTRRWNPKMREYIFTERNTIHIIDLQKTVKKVDEAYDAMVELAKQGDILFVGTKKQAQDSIKEEANTYPIVVEDFSYQIPDGSPLPFRYIIRIPDSWLRHCIAFLEELGTHRAKDNLWMYL